jgi:DNA adenine methylase
LAGKKEQKLKAPEQADLPFEREGVSILSPLRYPGGKKRLASYIAETLKRNKFRPQLFVEPLAGGASVALQLLNDDLVDTIALCDRDPMVASFWQTVFTDHEWLVTQLSKIELTLDNWLRFKYGRFRSTRTLALACIFLNRTSFSGILSPTAGPIGGFSQASEYKLDCRFNVEAVTKRIEQAAELADRVIFVKEGGWRQAVKSVKVRRYGAGEVLYYFDPPFYEKADRLYRYYFDHDDHQALHDALPGLGQHWILSYDAAETIINMYTRNGIGPKQVELLYSTTKPGELVKSQELIITSLPKLPKATRLWRTAEEWRAS